MIRGQKYKSMSEIQIQIQKFKTNLNCMHISPVSPLVTAAPPRISMEVTMMLVNRQNTRKVKWATLPQRACQQQQQQQQR
jgi:hypothetical protein